VSEKAIKVSKPTENGGVWWLHPAVAFSLPVIIAGVTAYGTAASNYPKFWRTPKYFDLTSLGLLFSVVAVFVCGCLLGGAQRRGRSRTVLPDWTLGIRWQVVRTLFNLSFALTILAYVIWFGVAIKNGLRLDAIVQVLHATSDATYDLRDEYLTTIPGVTTATQFGLAVVALGVPLGAVTGWRRVRWQLLAVFGLAFARSFLNSERLAIIELLVPFVVSFIFFRPPTTRRANRAIQAAPVLGTVVLFFFFAGAEYFRSWSSFYAQNESGFWSFIGLRLMGYYTTALNNGAMVWRVSHPLSYRLELITLDFVWRFPLVNNLLPLIFPFFGVPLDVSGYRYDALLQATANPELTNPSGVFGPIVDCGVAGGLLYWLLSGLICGWLYRQLKLHKPAGIFLYPLLYIGLAEAARILYWAEGRLFPAMFLLVVSVLFVLPNRRARIGTALLTDGEISVPTRSLTV
jgi:oligosaccharide repeat unit polymerase